MIENVVIETMEEASRQFMDQHDRDIVWLLATFGASQVEPLYKEIEALEADNRRMKRDHETLALAYAKLDQEFQRTRLHLEMLKAHAENGRLWLSSWREAEARADVFAGFYDRETNQLIREESNENQTGSTTQTVQDHIEKQERITSDLPLVHFNR